LSLERIGRGIRYLIVLNVFQVAATVIFYHIISTVLTKSEVGLTATLTFIYTTLTVLSSLALPVAGAKYVAEFLGRGEGGKASATARSVVRLALLSSSIMAIAFHIALILSTGDGGSLIDITPFSVICVASFLASLKLTYLSLLQGLQLFDRYAMANLSTTIASYLVGVFLVLKFGLTGFALGILTGEMIGLALALFFYPRRLPKAVPSHSYRTLLEFSTPIFTMQVVTILSNWADRILFFAVSLNLASFGVYDLAIRTAAALLVIAGFVEAITLPAFSKAHGQAGRENVNLLLRRALRYLGFMYFPAAFGLAAVSRTAMTLLYGEAYAEGSVALAMLSISSAFVAFGGLLGSALKSIGKTRVFVKVSLASLLIDAIIVVGLTFPLGIIGATLARISSSFLVFLLILRELRRWIKIEVDLDGLWKGLLGSIVSAASMFCVDVLQLASTPINLSIRLVFGLLTYASALVLLRALRREDFHVFRQVIPMFTGLIDSVENSVSRFIE